MRRAFRAYTALVLLFSSLLIGCSPIQPEVKAFLLANDLKGYLESCNMDEELAIQRLINLSLKDTLSYKEIWFSETEGKGIPAFERSKEGADEYYGSIKLQAYYWVLKIYQGDYVSDQGKICSFKLAGSQFVFDYRLLDFRESFAKGANFLRYQRDPSPASIDLHRRFGDWFAKMKEKGLPAMRESQMPPLASSEYYIFDLEELSN